MVDKQHRNRVAFVFDSYWDITFFFFTRAVFFQMKSRAFFVFSVFFMAISDFYNLAVKSIPAYIALLIKLKHPNGQEILKERKDSYFFRYVAQFMELTVTFDNLQDALVGNWTYDVDFSVAGNIVDDTTSERLVLTLRFCNILVRVHGLPER